MSTIPFVESFPKKRDEVRNGCIKQQYNFWSKIADVFKKFLEYDKHAKFEKLQPKIWLENDKNAYKYLYYT